MLFMLVKQVFMFLNIQHGIKLILEWEYFCHTTTFLTMHIVNCSYKEKWVFVMDIFTFISQSVGVYTGYVVT